MAKLVAAFASSHSVMLTATLADWQGRFLERDRKLGYFDRQGRPCTYADLEARAPADADALVTPAAVAARFEEVHAAMARLRRSIEAARLDALIVVGDDQNELLDEHLMPSIAVYYGETVRNAARPAMIEDWYVRAQMQRLEEREDRHYPCDSRLALGIIEGLLARGFDPAAMAGLRPGRYEGHAFSFVHRMYMGERAIPIVPVFLNTFYPPNAPSPARCLALGVAIGEIVAGWPHDIRVGVMASGGLSHFQAEVDLDRMVIDALASGNFEALAALDPARLQSGSSEIRNWIVLAGAARDARLEWLSYTPGYRTRALTGTGLCFASWRSDS